MSAQKLSILSAFLQCQAEPVDSISFAETTAVAIKVYPTATGETAAVFRVERGGLIGNYRSEGRNVLEPVWVPITADMSEDTIADRVESFMAQVEHQIDGTYARGLYLRNPQAYAHLNQ